MSGRSAGPSIIKCPTCYKPISSQVEFCPNCGGNIAATKSDFQLRNIEQLSGDNSFTMNAVWLAVALGAAVIVAQTFFSWFISLFFHDVLMKPTIIHIICGGALLISVALGKPLLSVGLQRILQLTDKGWRILTLRWGLFFLLFALLNEIVWRSQSTDTWVTYTALSNLPPTILFAISQVPFILKHKLSAKVNVATFTTSSGIRSSSTADANPPKEEPYEQPTARADIQALLKSNQRPLWKKVTVSILSLSGAFLFFGGMDFAAATTRFGRWQSRLCEQCSEKSGC